MKQRLFLFSLFSALLISLSCGFSIAAVNEAATSPVEVGLIHDSQDATRISLTVADFAANSIEVRNSEFDQFAIGAEPTLFQEGWPNLPFISRVVLVPPQSDINLVVHSINSRIENGWEPAIAPHELNGVVEDVPPADEYLSINGFWPPEAIKLSEPAILRGNRLVTVIMYPFQYNPQTGEMRFNDSFDFELEYVGNSGINPVIDPERDRPSSNMGRILDGLVVNSPQRDFANPKRGSYLLIYPDVNGVLDALQPLIDWRTRSGWEVHLQEVGNNANTGTVKRHIQTAYDEWDNPPEMVALVGDADGAIAIQAYNQTDHDYVMLDGNDILADAIIGRLSVSSTQELGRVVAKIVGYESDPYMGENNDDTGWFSEGMVCAGNQISGLSTILVNRWVKYELEARGFNDIHAWYYNARFQNQNVRQFFESEFARGVLFSNYRGWVGIEELDPNQVMNFRAHAKYPTVILLTCSSGNYIRELGFTEAFFRSRGGGTGAVGLCTNNTHVQFNNAET
ncbi:MAG: hypothetical protein HN757_18620 [Calditrichaeota bacterium]|nr:hypothetical protein [Calditrichota bacterium]